MLLASLQDAVYELGSMLPPDESRRLDRLVRQANALVLGYLRMPEPTDPALIPDSLRDTTVEVALRAYGLQATAGVRQQTSGPFSVTFTDQAAQGIYLTDSDRMSLGPYRRSAVSVQLVSERTA